MAIRTSKVDTIILPQLETSTVFDKCIEALQEGSFKNITPLRTLNEINARIANFTLYGRIAISVCDNGTGGSKVIVRSTANSDNIYALFRSPNLKIIDTFKYKLNAILDSSPNATYI